ncbi:Spo0B C-terminal domain-containing protein [Salibacterium aidingense]|uniref:Spo0B C-terminal domain-containing protein n=1 Tax=Salibacterium aidingense TaxID=384933 RepID=UPI0004276BA6|nr:Spo0B C-terminal domain-containing protein [Salibacterium aidingense]
MEEQRELDILRHSRHDWMNVVQIIKGNLSLNRLDRVEEILDETIRKAEHESRLIHLNIPRTALLILTFNWESHWLYLDIEVTDQQDCSLYENTWYEIISTFTRELDRAVKPGAENYLLITIHPGEDPYLEFDFQGEFRPAEGLKHWLSVYSDSDSCSLQDIVWNEKELLFVVLTK